MNDTYSCKEINTWGLRNNFLKSFYDIDTSVQSNTSLYWNYLWVNFKVNYVLFHRCMQCINDDKPILAVIVKFVWLMIKNAKTSKCVRNLRLKLHWKFKYLGKTLIVFFQMLVLYEIYQCCFFLSMSLLYSMQI